MNGYTNRKKDSWEQARLVAYFSANNLKKGTIPSDLFRIPGDPEIEVSSDKESFESLKTSIGEI